MVSLLWTFFYLLQVRDFIRVGSAWCAPYFPHTYPSGQTPLQIPGGGVDLHAGGDLPLLHRLHHDPGRVLLLLNQPGVAWQSLL